MSISARSLRAFQVLTSRNARRPSTATISDRHCLSPRALTLKMEAATDAGVGAAKAGISSSAGRRERVGEVDCFELSHSSVLKLQKGDITAWFVDGTTDAIVNAANEQMLGGGGVDGAIHRAAGPGLKVACYEVPEVRPGVRCPTGEARITSGFLLPVSRVIHTVGPIYSAVRQPEVLLRNAYRNSLKLAKENNIQYIAFPAISCGVYGYPFDEASKIAISTIKEFSGDFKEGHLFFLTSVLQGIPQFSSAGNAQFQEFPRQLWEISSPIRGYRASSDGIPRQFGPLCKFGDARTGSSGLQQLGWHFQVHFVLFSDDIYRVWLETSLELT